MVNYAPLNIFFNYFRYEKMPKQIIEYVIKTGTFCRTMFPIFIPICIYQYIRQVDRERYAEELLYEYTKSDNVKNFYDSSMKCKGTKNWKIQYDLYLIDKAVNS
ncbi:hypothetical protein, conserved [Plasmodium gonderi]|uniref:Uncharacterized protein n=1 Tax=Plasmodium gonderi TaxID=77519 RepID=A0A1Y1JLI8_PLAGO|nr:hypothetical protein, conserved [Plasmodium gonderi]GAW82335.1 hypothetical protein, conserved [Plasmodium gonderi]